METQLSLRAASTATDQYTSTVCLAGYANSAGTGASILKITWEENYCDGTLANVIVQDSSDNSAFSTLWDCGTLTGDQTKTLYTFDEWIRVHFDYTVGSSDEDPGARCTFNLRTYGMPNWPLVQITKPDLLHALDPVVVDTSKNFQRVWPEKMRLAKREIEGDLMKRGIDPQRLFTDGHAKEPSVPALEVAGALRTLYWIWFRAEVAYDETWSARLEALDTAYHDAMDAACTSGKLLQDVQLDTRPDTADEVRRHIGLYR